MKKLIVTGFPRSGTSLIMDFLQKIGYDTGGEWNEELNAGWEDEQVQKIVTTFQNNPFSETLILFLEKEIEKVDNIVVKHPRFLMVPELMRIWSVIHPNTSVLVTYREPIHVIASKKSHSNLGYYNNFSATELDKKFHDFIDILINLRIKHKIIYFPDFLESYDEVYLSISSLGIHIDKDRGRNIWHNIVDFDKVHYGRDT